MGTLKSQSNGPLYSIGILLAVDGWASEEGTGRGRRPRPRNLWPRPWDPL